MGWGEGKDQCRLSVVSGKGPTESRSQPLSQRGGYAQLFWTDFPLTFHIFLNIMLDFFHLLIFFFFNFFFESAAGSSGLLILLLRNRSPEASWRGRCIGGRLAGGANSQ